MERTYFCNIKQLDMTTIVIKENSKQARAIIEMLRAFPFVEIKEGKKPNAATLKAFQEIKDGKVIKAKNAKELMKKLLD